MLCYNSTGNWHRWDKLRLLKVNFLSRKIKWVEPHVMRRNTHLSGPSVWDWAWSRDGCEGWGQKNGLSQGIGNTWKYLSLNFSRHKNNLY